MMPSYLFWYIFAGLLRHVVAGLLRNLEDRLVYECAPTAIGFSHLLALRSRIARCTVTSVVLGNGFLADLLV